MKHQNVALMLFLAVLLVAGTADSAGLTDARQTVVLECGVAISEMDPPSPDQLILTIVALSRTPGAPDIQIGNQCGDAIGALINNGFRLLSATPNLQGVRVGTDPMMAPTLTSVQYLFVSWPQWR